MYLGSGGKSGHDTWLGTSEAIYGLPNVTNHAYVARLGGNKLNEPLLHFVCVLILVNQYEVPCSLQLMENIFFFEEQLQGKGLHGIESQNLVLDQGIEILGFDLLCSGIYAGQAVERSDYLLDGGVCFANEP